MPKVMPHASHEINTLAYDSYRTVAVRAQRLTVIEASELLDQWKKTMNIAIGIGDYAAAADALWHVMCAQADLDGAIWGPKFYPQIVERESHASAPARGHR